MSTATAATATKIQAQIKVIEKQIRDLYDTARGRPSGEFIDSLMALTVR
jgi:hypothetical protein